MLNSNHSFSSSWKKKVASPAPEPPYVLPLLQTAELQLCAGLLVLLSYILLKDADPKAH